MASTPTWLPRAGARRGFLQQDRPRTSTFSDRCRTSLRWKGSLNGVALAVGLCLCLATASPSKAQELVWAKRAGGTSGDGGESVATDGAGNSYVTGTFVGTATFGSGETNQTILTAAGNQDMFVAKYRSTGALVWAKRAGGTSGEELSLGIATDGAGNSYVTGFFHETATFASVRRTRPF